MIQDVKTRWNSQLLMIKRLLKIYPAVYKVLYENKKSHLVLTEEEISNLEKLEKLLDKFEEATKMVSSEKVPTAGLILPMMYQLKKHLTERATDTAMVKRCKAAMLADLDKRYTGDKVQHVLQQASALDPRFKGLGWMGSEKKEECYETLLQYSISIGRELEDKLDNNQSEVAGEGAEQREECGGFFDEDLFASPEPECLDMAAKVADEIKRYLREATPHQYANTVEWWRCRAPAYPIL